MAQREQDGVVTETRWGSSPIPPLNWPVTLGTEAIQCLWPSHFLTYKVSIQSLQGYLRIDWVNPHRDFAECLPQSRRIHVGCRFWLDAWGSVAWGGRGLIEETGFPRAGLAKAVWLEVKGGEGGWWTQTAKGSDVNLPEGFSTWELKFLEMVAKQDSGHWLTALGESAGPAGPSVSLPTMCWWVRGHCRLPQGCSAQNPIINSCKDDAKSSNLYSPASLVWSSVPQCHGSRWSNCSQPAAVPDVFVSVCLRASVFGFCRQVTGLYPGIEGECTCGLPVCANGGGGTCHKVPYWECVKNFFSRYK